MITWRERIKYFFTNSVPRNIPAVLSAVAIALVLVLCIGYSAV